jgi:hypothetical protein
VLRIGDTIQGWFFCPVMLMLMCKVYFVKWRYLSSFESPGVCTCKFIVNRVHPVCRWEVVRWLSALTNQSCADGKDMLDAQWFRGQLVQAIR